MILKHLTEEYCSICGADTKHIEMNSQHVVTGQYREVRKYTCDRVLVYCPNFDQIDQTSLCVNSKEFKEFKNKREKARIRLRNYINKLDVDEEWKNSIINATTYLRG